LKFGDGKRQTAEWEQAEEREMEMEMGRFLGLESGFITRD